MPRLSDQKRAELEGFWRFHHEEWQKSTFNQREYCELHQLPLKRFGNWRAQFKHEAAVAQSKLLYRRGGGLRHMSGHMSDRDNEPTSTGYVPSVRAMPEGRRNFRPSDKRRIVEEALAPGSSISGVAKRYGITKRLLFRWKRELIEPEPEPIFLPVRVSDAPETSVLAAPSVATPALAPIIVERPPSDVEVELVGGRRIRFGHDTDPDTVRAMIALLEGDRS